MRSLKRRPSAELAERIGLARADESALAPPLVPVAREAHLPLSFSQQRLWFLDQFDPGSAVYNLPIALRLSGALDVSALERSLQEIVRRHEALRTTFTMRRWRFPSGHLAKSSRRWNGRDLASCGPT